MIFLKTRFSILAIVKYITIKLIPNFSNGTFRYKTCPVIIADMKRAPFVLITTTALLEPSFSASVGVNYKSSLATLPMVGTGFSSKMSFNQRVKNLIVHEIIIRKVMGWMFDPAECIRKEDDIRKELGVQKSSTFSDARLVLVNSNWAIERPRDLPPFVKVCFCLACIDPTTT